jgi:hypothetical protein
MMVTQMEKEYGYTKLEKRYFALRHETRKISGIEGDCDDALLLDGVRERIQAIESENKKLQVEVGRLRNIVARAQGVLGAESFNHDEVVSLSDDTFFAKMSAALDEER